MKNSHRHFSNTACKYYPCHDLNGRDINCLFCFCPLYSLGTKCGGNFEILADGCKDCSKCTLVHCENGYDYIMSKLKLVAESQTIICKGCE